MNNSNRRCIRGLSPVVATVFIIAVAVALAAGVGYWVTGMMPLMSQREEMRVLGCYITDSTTAVVYVKNTGSKNANIDYVLINGRLSNPGGPLDIVTEPGDVSVVELDASHYHEVEEFVSGVRYDFIVHTSTGLSYPVQARAP